MSKSREVSSKRRRVEAPSSHASVRRQPPNDTQDDGQYVDSARRVQVRACVHIHNFKLLFWGHWCVAFTTSSPRRSSRPGTHYLSQDRVPRSFPAVRGNWPSTVELDLQLDEDFAGVVEVGQACFGSRSLPTVDSPF